MRSFQRHGNGIKPATVLHAQQAYGERRVEEPQWGEARLRLQIIPASGWRLWSIQRTGTFKMAA
jgi:hypothetical protein